MGRTPSGSRNDGQLRSAAIRAVRRHRGLTPRDMATALNMPLRTYERFEGGQGRLNMDYLHRFADAAGADPYGLLYAIVIGSPEFAVRTADNKFMTAFTILLQTYDRRMGDRIRDLDARALIAAFGELFDALVLAGDRRADEADRFLGEGRARLAEGRARPGR